MSKMDPTSDDFQFGVLSTQLKGLSGAVRDLTNEVKALSSEVREIKLFRAKVVGMSLAASAIVSIVVPLLLEAWKSWAR